MRFVRFHKRITSKFFLFIIIAALSPFSSITLLTDTPAEASEDAARWTSVAIPAEGTSGDWVLAAGSDIQYLAAAPDGTLYAYCRGLPYTLYKSRDGGTGWSYAGKVEDDIVGIAVSPANANTVYYATS